VRESHVRTHPEKECFEKHRNEFGIGKRGGLKKEKKRRPVVLWSICLRIGCEASDKVCVGGEASSQREGVIGCGGRESSPRENRGGRGLGFRSIVEEDFSVMGSH